MSAMKRLFFIVLLTWSFINPFTGKADTIDVWLVKRNGQTIINSNQMLIVYSNQPMQVNLSAFSDSDTLQILYWTDSGIERQKWFYTFKDSNNVFIEKFTNPIDSSVRCIPAPCKTFDYRKNFIPFTVGKLKELLKTKNIDKIFIEFEHENPAWSDSYLNKKVCVISKDK